ncbi:MAG: hypothetical protein KDA24_29335, partial [Deltaproteobacteria bacterium]|nr:hypothetical protein [Deltaproteobacteria bacterium]
AHNPYGADIREARTPGVSFEDDLPFALDAVDLLDSDGDGVDNLAEILAGSLPGFEASVEPECGDQTNFDNPWYRVGTYDPAFAFKRVTLDFCGRSPRYEEMQALEGDSDPMGRLAEQLDLCLTSPYWQDVLRELAMGVVRPVGPATDINILGNWEWDVRLFIYAMSGDRDAADLMRADYLVVEEPPNSGRLVAIDAPRTPVEEYAQPLAQEDRFGLITTRFSLAMNVMFAPMPRTLVAHVYRELLGLDLARSEGLYPVDETGGAYDWPSPADVDDKGVWQEGCAGCHATLDPASYPWIRYNGIDLDGDTTGAFLPERAEDIVPTTEGNLWGEPVDGPAEWVEAALSTDAFPQRMSSIVWQYIFRRPPYSCEQDEYDVLWQDFRDEGRNVEAMLHRLVVTDAYGVP